MVFLSYSIYYIDFFTCVFVFCTSLLEWLNTEPFLFYCTKSTDHVSGIVTLCWTLSWPHSYLVGAVEQSEDVSFLHGYFSGALLLVVIQGQYQFLSSLVISWCHLLLCNETRCVTDVCFLKRGTATQCSEGLLCSTA